MRKSFPVCVVLLLSFLLASCSSDTRRLMVPYNHVTSAHLIGPAGWHADNERRCLASGQVRESRFIRQRASLGTPVGCGAERPFVITALNGGHVALTPAATLRCPMVRPVEAWLQNVVQPAARRYLNTSVVRLKVAASYACRSRNNKPGAKLSEHGRANALDVSAFHLADGSVVSIKGNWRDFGSSGRFLRATHSGACRHFSTVLGPDADRHHHDHLHLDLARHGRDGRHRVCR